MTALGVSLALASSSAAHAEDAESEPARETNQTARYVLTGVGLGALGVGTAVALHSLHSDDDNSPSQAPAYVLGGLGVGSLAFGSFIGILALEQKGIRDDHCSETQRLCDAEGIEANRMGRRYTSWSMLGLAAGSVALAGSIYLFGSRDSATQIDGSVSSESLSLRLVTRW